MALDTDQQVPVPPTGEPVPGGWPPPPVSEAMPGWPVPPVGDAMPDWPVPPAEAVPVDTLAAPLPGTFAFGPSSSARAAGRGLRAAVAVVAFAGAAFAGYTVMSGGEEPAAPVPPPVVAKPKAAALTSDPNVVNSMLKNMATAEESFFIDNTKYTAKMTDLQKEGVVLDPRVKASVVRVSAGGYCLRASGAGRLVRYYSSKTGKVSRTPC